MFIVNRSIIKLITRLAYGLGVLFLVSGMTLGAFVNPVLAGNSDWDKSSLYFDESFGCQGNCTEARAKVCNGGDTMMGSTTFEVYYSSNGNPKPAPQGSGSKIGDGIIPAIPSTDPDSCVVLSFPTNNVSGNYTFRAFQRDGHPGQGDLWSGQCSISCSIVPSATPTKTLVPPTATSTVVPPTATNTTVPPTATFTSVPPTATFTAVPPTATFTAVPPTATITPDVPEITTVPPTATNTSVPPTATNTSVPPTATTTPNVPEITAVPPTMTNTPPANPTGTRVVPETTPVGPTNTPSVPQVSLTPGMTSTATKVVRQSTLPPPAVVTSQPLIPVTGTDFVKPGTILGSLQYTLMNLGMVTIGLALVLHGLSIKLNLEN